MAEDNQPVKAGLDHDTALTIATPEQAAAVQQTMLGYKPQMLKTEMTIPKPTWADHYCIAMCLILGPFALMIWIMFTAFSLPLLAIWTFYMRCFVKAPTDRDTSWAFVILATITYPYAAILYVFSAFWWWFVFYSVMFMSLPACFIRVFFLCQGKKIIRNFHLLWPWMKFNHFSYFMLARAVVGEIHRQGLKEFVFGMGVEGGWAANIAYIPLIKYCWSANPFLYVLDEVFVNEWTPPIKNTSEEDTIDAIKIFVSRFKHPRPERNVIDHVRFAAHYAFGRSIGEKSDSVIGIQFPESSKMINMTNTIFVTKDYRNEYSLEGKNCRSPYGKTGVYVVVLNWLSHHFLTGYVEVNYRTDKGLEHPLWVIVAPDNYWSMLSLSWVNDLFANFVPDVIEFVEVFGKDGDELEEREKKDELKEREKKENKV